MTTARLFKRCLKLIHRQLVPDATRMPVIAHNLHSWTTQQEALVRQSSIVRIVTVFMVIAVIWSMIAQVSEVARGESKIVPSQRLQVVQAVDGGVITEIFVSEGQVVQADQPLLQLDQTRFLSSLRENQAIYDSLVAKVARLKALAESSPFTVPDSVFKSSPAVVEQERQLYESRQREYTAMVAIARQQLSQKRQERDEVIARRKASASALELSKRELDAMRPLVKTGAVSDADILKLEKEVSRSKGERDMAEANLSKIEYGIEEAQQKIREVELTFKNEARRDLSETQAKLNSLSENSVGLSDKVQKTTLRAPVGGIIKRVLFTTQGAVVTPGKELLEIVPNDDVLVFETRIMPRDIAFIRPGQPAIVKISAYDYTIYGSLTGKVVSIAADSLIDDYGKPYYVVRVQSDMKQTSVKYPLIAGMVAEVDIVTAQRSLMTYLLKPLLRAGGRAFFER